MPRLARSVLSLVALASVLTACGLSKSQAMDGIQAGVKEDGTCTLPLEMLSKLKVQHTTKAVCAPKEGGEKQKACIDALVAAGVTKAMPDAYMVAWPDDVSSASLKDIPAYERRARNLVYSTCVELGLLRDGRFVCADAKASEIVRVTPLDDRTTDVRYAREVKLRPSLTAIEAACGQTIHPAAEAEVQFTKVDKGPWTLVTKPPAE